MIQLRDLWYAELDLSGPDIATGDTTFTLTAGVSELPTPTASDPIILTIWDRSYETAANAWRQSGKVEFIEVTSKDDGAETVDAGTRGYGITSAQAYSSSDGVTYGVLLGAQKDLFDQYFNIGSSDVHLPEFTGDLDNHLQGIVYATGAATNSPNGNAGVCRAYSLDDDNVVQVFEEIGADATYQRRKLAGTWQSSPAWTQIPLEGSSPTFEEVKIPGTNTTASPPIRVFEFDDDLYIENNIDDVSSRGRVIFRAQGGGNAILIDNSAVNISKTLESNDVDIGGGEIDGTPIGETSRESGKFTDVDISGTLSKSSGTFLIGHPLSPTEKDLYHGFVEAPRYDLIYRGRVSLVDGTAEVDIDSASNMSAGTFDALTKNATVTSLQNQGGFARVKPSEVVGGKFMIECEEEDCTDEIAWVVIAERDDDFIRNDDFRTDKNGSLIPEWDKEEPEDVQVDTKGSTTKKVRKNQGRKGFPRHPGAHGIDEETLFADEEKYRKFQEGDRE